MTSLFFVILFLAIYYILIRDIKLLLIFSFTAISVAILVLSRGLFLMWLIVSAIFLKERYFPHSTEDFISLLGQNRNRKIKDRHSWDRYWKEFEATYKNESGSSQTSTGTSFYDREESTAPDFHSNDPHKVLGVRKDATIKEIQNKYRKLLKTYHPDIFSNKNKKEAEFITKKVSWAYKKLVASYEHTKH